MKNIVMGTILIFFGVAAAFAAITTFLTLALPFAALLFAWIAVNLVSVLAMWALVFAACALFGAASYLFDRRR